MAPVVMVVSRASPDTRREFRISARPSPGGGRAQAAPCAELPDAPAPCRFSRARAGPAPRRECGAPIALRLLLHPDAMSRPLAVSDANFSDLVERAPGLTLVDVWAPWCAPCLLFAPVVARVAATYAARVQVATLNVDEGTETARRLGIRAIPTLLLFEQGRVIDAMDGAAPQAVVEAFLDAHLQSTAA